MPLPSGLGGTAGIAIWGCRVAIAKFHSTKRSYGMPHQWLKFFLKYTYLLFEKKHFKYPNRLYA